MAINGPDCQERLDVLKARHAAARQQQSVLNTQLHMEQYDGIEGIDRMREASKNVLSQLRTEIPHD